MKPRPYSCKNGGVTHHCDICQTVKCKASSSDTNGLAKLHSLMISGVARQSKHEQHHLVVGCKAFILLVGHGHFPEEFILN